MSILTRRGLLPMRRNRTCRRLAARIALAGAPLFTLPVACSDAIFEPAPADVYVLTIINGRPLPVTVGDPSTNQRALYADTIRFITTDRYERFRWFGERETDSDGIRLERELSVGIVRRSGGSVTLVDGVCADPNALALCVPPDTAALDAGDLILRGPAPPAGIKRFESG
jgi:hypothetical protein